MDNSLRNAFIGAIVTIAVAFIGAWIQLNSRIAVLEVQVANDHATLQETASNMKEVKTILQDIQIKVTHLNDTKVDKRYE